jgi:hypothetical protein
MMENKITHIFLPNTKAPTLRYFGSKEIHLCVSFYFIFGGNQETEDFSSRKGVAGVYNTHKSAFKILEAMNPPLFQSNELSGMFTEPEKIW